MSEASDRAYQEAKARIEAALREGSTKLDLGHGLASESRLDELLVLLSQVKRLQSLDLSSNSLRILPESLGQLTQLQVLDLSYNQLTELPQSLGQLIPLQVLDLSYNQLTQLPQSLGQLTHLRELDLSYNRLTQLPQSFSQLTQLQELDLSNNQLTQLPESFGLAQLRYLYLSHNQLTQLPEAFGQLAQLRYLYLSHNQLTQLPELIAQPIYLQILDLGANQLTDLPQSLGQLVLLQSLLLDQNQLRELPESLGRLAQSLRELFLHGNDALKLSAEILGPTWQERGDGKRPADPKAILAFYFGRRQQGAKPLNEVKLLLVGHGRVGKTSISKALRGVPHDDREPETPGIERHPLRLATGDSAITAHIWDFGGQEFLHQTHQFFFSRRSIYLVVLSGRQGRPMQEAEYWLRLIRTYGTGSPVVIALNQIKAHPFTVDEYFLQENYPEVVAVVKTDCDPRVGIEPLKDYLGKFAGDMPSVREKIDPAWSRVRLRLEEIEESFVSFARYRELCSEEGIKTPEQQETLATILDCLGIALNYRDDPRLRDTSVLKPRWLVDGIYSILRWLHKHETNGEMRLAEFPSALPAKDTYPLAMHEFLLALMEKFELCFPIEGEAGVYLVPGLLNANQPRELKDFMGSDARRIQFRYDDVRPPGLLPRFIVRSHTLSEVQPRWLRGVVLARGSARALVRGDHEGRATDVYALGEKEDRVWLTEFILAEMRVLNDKLPVRTLVESETTPRVWSELEILRQAAQDSPQATRLERSVDGATVDINVRQTLLEIENPESRTTRDDSLRLFICYAHDDERQVRQLIPSLKVLARRGYIAPWRDTDLVPGEDWDDTIKERLSKSQIILFMLSRKFLASDYITHQERPMAMALMTAKKAVVVPVLLSPCLWREEDVARLEKLPRKDDPISSFTPREDGWALVEQGLKKLVEQDRKIFYRRSN